MSFHIAQRLLRFYFVFNIFAKVYPRVLLETTVFVVGK